MKGTPSLENLSDLDGIIEPMLSAARIPGASVAVVVDRETVLAKGYGLRDVAAKLPCTAQTLYPIASTTKAINATLLGMLVDDGLLSWDVPVQTYAPGFRLGDALSSSRVTVRDLITLRTGLPRHDWLWLENPMTRAELVHRLRYLEVSAPFRERFQYNNLTATAAGHIAELVTGESWETLVQRRILDPLEMRATTAECSTSADVSLSYHETATRAIEPTFRLATEVTAPSGGSLHSNVTDMARWLSFNLDDGQVNGRRLIRSQTLQEIHSPHVLVGSDPAAPAPHAAYAMGWFVYRYNGSECWSHGGYLHDVSCDVMFFRKERIGLVSCTNFGFPTLARLINQHIFDHLMGREPELPLAKKLQEYERKVIELQQRDSTLPRATDTSPLHALDDYTGQYFHPGYGTIRIERQGRELSFRRNRLVLPLEHWHYDVWAVRDASGFFIHAAHAFDRASRFMFETTAEGRIGSVTIPLEPSTAPIRFLRQ